MSRKIVLIGAGSAVFTQGLVADLILAQDLAPLELGLVDIDPRALETAEGLSRRMVEAKGAAITVQASTDRREILPGADVVVTTVGVGGRRAWEADVFIPRQYGIFQPVGDTVMPGGISRAMRMIPALVDIARDVKALCPQAWYFNYSNPMAANCWAIRQATGVPVVGLCHGTFHVERALAALINAPQEEVTSLYGGLNHMTFFTELRWQGRDAWPVARKRAAQAQAQSPDMTSLGEGFPDASTYVLTPFCWSLFDAYGAFPGPNDRHVTEFFPERFPQGRYYGKTLGVDAYSLERTTAGGDRTYAEMQAKARGEAPLDERIFQRAVGEHEQLLEIWRSLDHDGRRIFAANLPNRGTVPNLPDDAVLEVPAVATAGGLRPLPMPEFPDTLAAILAHKLMAIRLTVEAALAGDRRLFVEALLADGAVTDHDTAARLAEDLLAAQRAYLPDFFPEK